MSKHTPGPWMVGEWIGQCNKPEHEYNHPGKNGDNPCVYDPVFYAGGSIAAKGGINVIKCEYGDVSISDADLLLMAAAPDLLEALEKVLAMGITFHSAIEENIDYDGIVDFEAWEKDARAAIAKARGEA